MGIEFNENEKEHEKEKDLDKIEDRILHLRLRLMLITMRNFKNEIHAKKLELTELEEKINTYIIQLEEKLRDLPSARA